MATIEQFDGGPAQAEAAVGEMLREYLLWCGERLAADHGVVFDDEDAAVAAHHRPGAPAADARAIGYGVARLETATFMREAHGLYRSLGFQRRPMFENAEASMSGLESLMLFMELRLDRAARV